MLCVTLQEFVRACAPSSGGVSDLAVFDPNDYNFTQPAAINGVAQKYSAIALRAGATGTGAVAATATFTITNVGADGDVITVRSPNGSIILGSFTKTATESTPTLLATAIAAAITAGGTGFTAVGAAAVVTVTAPTSYGDTLNTLQLVISDGGTIETTQTAFTGGVTGTGGKIYKMTFLRDEAEWTWRQSVRGCSVKYEHSFNFQLPENSHTLTTFMQALDAASCCCGLGMVLRLNDGKIFIAGEKYVNGSSIQRFDLFNNGSNGTSGKLFDDFNGGNMVITGPYSRSLYEYDGDWADIEALMP